MCNRCGHSSSEHFNLQGESCECTRDGCSCDGLRQPGDASEYIANSLINQTIERQKQNVVDFGKAVEPVSVDLNADPHKVVKSTEKVSRLPMATADKICDALGLPKNIYKATITMDWSAKKFEVTASQWLNDESAQRVLEAIESEKK